MTRSARALAPVQADPPAQIEARTAAELARLARAAGVKVTEPELRAAVSGMAPEALARLPASYARDLETFAAAGVDLNEPDHDAPIFEGCAEDAIRFLESAEGEPCASSG
jgi:hypothetical protein